MPEQEKPLPCPFCGSQPKVDETYWRGVCALREYQCSDTDCPMHRLPLQTLLSWNTRPEPDEVAELRAVVEKLGVATEQYKINPGSSEHFIDLMEAVESVAALTAKSGTP